MPSNTTIKVTGIIEVKVHEKMDGYHFKVIDNGAGIDEKYFKKVFEVFQRLLKNDVEGTGIGLSIVKKLVELNGGTVDVQSVLGRGTTFDFGWKKEWTQTFPLTGLPI